MHLSYTSLSLHTFETEIKCSSTGFIRLYCFSPILEKADSTSWCFFKHFPGWLQKKSSGTERYLQDISAAVNLPGQAHFWSIAPHLALHVRPISFQPMCALEIASERKDDFSNQVQLRKEVMNGGSRDAAEVYLFYLKQSRPSAKTTCNNSFGRSKFPLLSSIRVVTLKPYHYSNDKLAIFLLIRVSKEKRNNDS